MTFVFAFSISHFVSTVGADAGFAAIIGLAILVLLYFAQARETTTLRDEATSANQRVGELERRVALLGRPEVTPAPRPAGAPAPQPAGAVALSSGQPATATAGQRAPLPSATPAPRPMAIPAAPAGVAAPALISATRLIPAPEPVLEDAVAAGGPAGPAAASATAVATPPAMSPPASASPPASDGSSQPASGSGTPPPAVLPKPAPATAAGAPTPPPATAAASAADAAARPPAPSAPASNGTGEHPVPQPAPAATASPPAQKPPSSPQQGAPPRRVQIRSGAAVPPSLSLGGTATRSPARRWLPVLVAVLLVGAIVTVLLVVTSSNGGNKPKPASATRSTNAPVPATPHAFNPSSVTVAVLNGTDVSQLAHKVAQKLLGTGYRQGAVATAADQTHTSSIVAFLPGFRHDAVEVASALKLPSSSIQPADQSASAVACPPPSACRANVIVTVGRDLSSTP